MKDDDRITLYWGEQTKPQRGRIIPSVCLRKRSLRSLIGPVCLSIASLEPTPGLALASEWNLDPKVAFWELWEEISSFHKLRGEKKGLMKAEAARRGQV